MEYEDDGVFKAKIYTDKTDTKNNVEISQNENSHLKKEENKDKHKNKVKYEDKNIKNDIKISQDENNDSMKESDNKDICEDTYKSKDTRNGIQTSEDKNSMEVSENEDCEIKCKDEDEKIQNDIKTLQDDGNDLKQNKNSDVKEALKNKYTHEVESDDESMEDKSVEDKSVEDEYCSDATYLAHQMALEERLCQEESVQLYNLRVQLRHKVPPQHDIETRAGSHMPTQKEIKEFERIISLKRGSYSYKEDKIIANNWKAFAKLHNWDRKNIKPFLQLRIGKFTYMRNITERRKFVQFLADGLPDRTLYSVYHRFRNLYENNLQRRYRPEEDQMIIDHLEHNPSLDKRRKYADLAKVLKRTRNSIWRRYRILKKKNKRKEDD